MKVKKGGGEFQDQADRSFHYIHNHKIFIFIIILAVP
jgi:hypothetical protein